MLMAYGYIEKHLYFWWCTQNNLWAEGIIYTAFKLVNLGKGCLGITYSFKSFTGLEFRDKRQGKQFLKWNIFFTGMGKGDRERPTKTEIKWPGIMTEGCVSLEKAMAPHSSTLAWKIPWTKEPGRLHSMMLLRVRHDWTTSLSCIGEGNGNPLQCSCLENPRDGGAWWAAVCGVAQSRTRLKWLSSSSSSRQK